MSCRSASVTFSSTSLWTVPSACVPLSDASVVSVFPRNSFDISLLHRSQSLSYRSELPVLFAASLSSIIVSWACTNTDMLPVLSASASALCRASSSSVGYVYSRIGAPNTSANCAQSATSFRLYITHTAAFASIPSSSGSPMKSRSGYSSQDVPVVSVWWRSMSLRTGSTCLRGIRS